jgi:penicillin-binding protein 2
LAILGLGFLVMFSLLFMRLWFVQVARGAVFEEEASLLQLKSERTPAARGEIRDRNGELLVTSRIVPELRVDRSEVAEEDEEDLIQQLSALLETRPVEVRAQFDEAGSLAEVSLGVIDLETMEYVLTHVEDFPGTSIVDRPIRIYPQGELMAHVIGYVGKPSEEDLEELGEDLDPNGTVGKAGVERAYDSYLQGEQGTLLNRIDRSGNIVGLDHEILSVQGATVYLTLDTDLQRQTEFAVQEAMALSSEIDEGSPDLGAAMVMDIDDGSIVSMYSYPDFDPGLFVGGITERDFSILQERKALTNLALRGAYPPGSTFKAITWAAAINEQLYPRGITSHTGAISCEGELDLGIEDNEGGQLAFRDAGHGATDLHTALGESCNVYFWQVALTIWREYKNDPENEDILQRWARQLGLGAPTGIDLPFEHAGRMPDRELYEEWAASPTGSSLLAPDRFTEALWRGGDIMGIAIGQGDVLATPLQMAVAYAALVNGGDVLQPRVVARVEAVDGTTVYDPGRTVVRHIDFTAEHEQFIREDLSRVTNGGTASAAFSVMQNAWQTGGKTGTSERDASDFNISWFIGVAPINDPKYVVVVMIVDGGLGGRVAAPAARNLIQYLLPNEPVTPIRPGGLAEPADLEVEQGSG